MWLHLTFFRGLTLPHIKQTFFTYSYKEHYTVALPQPAASLPSASSPRDIHAHGRGDERGGRVWLSCMLVCVSVMGVLAALTLTLSGYKSCNPTSLALDGPTKD